MPASWMVGDLMSDVLAGLNAGCRSILVKSGPGTARRSRGTRRLSGRYLVLPDFVAAAETILGDRRGHRFLLPQPPVFDPGGAEALGSTNTVNDSPIEAGRLRRSGSPIWATSIP